MSKPLEDITGEEFKAYENVRSQGLYNMLDPAARELSGLDRYTYFGVMEHYTELAALYIKEA